MGMFDFMSSLNGPVAQQAAKQPTGWDMLGKYGMSLMNQQQQQPQMTPLPPQTLFGQNRQSPQLTGLGGMIGGKPKGLDLQTILALLGNGGM